MFLDSCLEHPAGWICARYKSYHYHYHYHLRILSPYCQLDNKGRNFLHIAIQKSDIESVLFLISVHANVNSCVQDSSRHTPLHLAVQAGSEIIVRNLVRESITHSFYFTIILKTIRAYWSKYRVVTNQFFSELITQREFLHGKLQILITTWCHRKQSLLILFHHAKLQILLHGVTANSLYLSFSPCKATNLTTRCHRKQPLRNSCCLCRLFQNYQGGEGGGI